ncbi:hypothetical protein [Chitinophaga sp. YIM B06452]|uniref:hypothetical protein n=1 Tax=Chitinophaga sp. YIM B06452 TaxID=3082158 RepID=UPI0031FEDE90
MTEIKHRIGYCIANQYSYFKSLSNLSREFKAKLCLELGWTSTTFDNSLNSSREAKNIEREAIHKVAYELLEGIIKQNFRVLETEFTIDISALETKAQSLNSEINYIKSHVSLFTQKFTDGTAEH